MTQRLSVHLSMSWITWVRMELGYTNESSVPDMQQGRSWSINWIPCILVHNFTKYYVGFEKQSDIHITRSKA